MSIEVIKLLVSAATPITVAIVGFFLNRHLKSIDNAQWQSRKIIEKRLELFDEIAPKLNQIFCIVSWVGYWKDISPRDLIQTKRYLDRFINIYKHLLGENFHQSYEEFIHLVFQTYSGKGKDALIRSEISNFDGDRKTHTNYQWEDDFDELFDQNLPPPKHEVTASYEKTMICLRESIGLQ